MTYLYEISTDEFEGNGKQSEEFQRQVAPMDWG